MTRPKLNATSYSDGAYSRLDRHLVPTLVPSLSAKGKTLSRRLIADAGCPLGETRANLLEPLSGSKCGMIRSVISRSGAVATSVAHRSIPSLASPAISMGKRSHRAYAMPFRTMAWSSARTTRMGCADSANVYSTELRRVACFIVLRVPVWSYYITPAQPMVQLVIQFLYNWQLRNRRRA